MADGHGRHIAKASFDVKPRLRWGVGLVLGSLSCSGSAAIVIVASDAGDEAPVPPPPPPKGDATVPDGPPPKVDWTPHVIDFGAAPCGGEAPESKSLVLQNSGLLRLRYSASTDSPSFVVKAPSSGEIFVGTSTSVIVLAQPVPSDSPGLAPITGNLLVELDDTLHRGVISVPLKLVPSGAELSVAPTTVAFGPVLVGASASLPIEIRNSGTSAANLLFAQPSDPDFVFDWDGGPSPVTLAPDASVQGAVVWFRPSDAGAHTGVVRVLAGVGLCGSAPSIAVQGQGVVADAGVDASDAGADASSDASDAGSGGDAGDAGDASSDASPEASADAGADATSDAGADAAADAPTD